jgi:hypothetical protein
VPEEKCRFAANNARLFQLRGNPPRRISGMQQQGGLRRWRGRTIDQPCHPSAKPEDGKQEELNEPAQGSSLKAFSDCHKIARVLGPRETGRSLSPHNIRTERFFGVLGVSAVKTSPPIGQDIYWLSFESNLHPLSPKSDRKRGRSPPSKSICHKSTVTARTSL